MWPLFYSSSLILPLFSSPSLMWPLFYSSSLILPLFSSP
jgi:hypothetical protein